MRLWLDRIEKQNWIKNVSGFNELILIYGILGTGKTVLVRDHVQSENLKSKSYSFNRSLDRVLVLGGTKGEALESVLVQAEKSWAEFDVIIWDDVQHVKLADRYAILQFVKSRTGKKHIFISEENIQEELGYGVPSLLIESFTETEVEIFLNAIPANFRAPFQSKELFMKTGGLPLLVQLSVQQQRYFSDHKIWMNQLSATEKKIIWISVLLTEGVEENGPLTKEADAEVWNDLIKKNILEKRESRYFLTSALQILFETEMTSAFASTAAGEILQHQLGLSPLTQFKLALISQNLDQVNVLDIKPDDIEVFSVQSILFYEKLCADFLKSSAGLKSNAEALFRVKRIYLNGLILASKRQEALSFIASEMSSNFFETLTTEKEWFAYDAIYWQMRSGRYEEASGPIAKLINKATSPIREFVSIEQAIPFVQTDPDRAIQVLDRGLKQLDSIKDQKLKTLCEAQARYQLAIAKTTKKLFSEAREENRIARALYLQINKPYFASFCLLNSTWAGYYNGSWNDFAIGVLDLKKASEKYGFEYLGVGADLLFSLMLFESGRDEEAVNCLDRAIAKAKKIKHVNMLSHLLLAKLKFEFEKTNYEAAIPLISELKSLGQENSKKLKIFEKAEALSLNDLMDEFPDMEQVSDPFFARMILLAGHPIKEWKPRTPRDFLIEDELKFRKSNTERDQKQFLIDLKIMETRCLQFQGAVEIHWAAKLSRLEQSSTKSTKEIENELQTAPLSLATRKAFTIWLSDIKNQTQTQITERWQHWRFNQSIEVDEYQITTKDRKVSSVGKPSRAAAGFYVDDTLGEVYFNSKKIEELSKKPVLRQVLIFLLENYPEACTKASLAVRIWGESYSPLVHDPRVYTSIQRLRKLISATCILNQESGYALNRQLDFILIRANRQDFRIEDRTQSFIFEALTKKSKTLDPWMKKAEMAEGVQTTDSTLKRALAFLVDQGKIERSGAGPSVKYRRKVAG